MRQSFNPVVREIMEELQGSTVQHQSAAMPTPGQEQVPGQVKKPSVKLKPSAALASKAAGSIQAIADKAAQDAAAGVQDDVAQQQGIDPEQQKQINKNLKAQPKPTRATATAASRGIQGDAIANRAAGLGGKPVQATEGEVFEAEGKFKKTHSFVSADGTHAFNAGKNQDYGTWDHRHYVKNGKVWKHLKDNGYDGHETEEDAAAAAKADCASYDASKKTNEAKEFDEHQEKHDELATDIEYIEDELKRASERYNKYKNEGNQARVEKLKERLADARAALTNHELKKPRKTNEEVAGEAGGAKPPLPKETDDVLTNPDAEEDYNEKQDEPRAAQRAKEIFPGAKPNTAAGYGKDGAGRPQNHHEVTNPRQTTVKKTGEKEEGEKTEETVLSDAERTKLLDEVFAQ